MHFRVTTGAQPVSYSQQQRAGRAIWNGTIKEELDLLAAIQHNCACIYDGMDGWLSACSAHNMLAGDQRALDGLLWNRRIVKRLLTEEGIAP
jgi:hypothetical protein